MQQPSTAESDATYSLLFTDAGMVVQRNQRLVQVTSCDVAYLEKHGVLSVGPNPVVECVRYPEDVVTRPVQTPMVFQMVAEDNLSIREQTSVFFE